MNLFEHCTHRYFICNRIGFSIAERLAFDGASVVVSSQIEDNVKRAVKKLEDSGCSASGVVCQVKNAEDRRALIDEALKKFGGIDILVSNADINPSKQLVLEVIYWFVLSVHLL